MLPVVQMESPVFPFVPIASGATGHHWKEPGSNFFAPSLQVIIHIDKILPEPSVLQSEKSQFFQPFFIWKMFQYLHCFHGPLLNFV